MPHLVPEQLDASARAVLVQQHWQLRPCLVHCSVPGCWVGRAIGVESAIEALSDHLTWTHRPKES